VKGPAYAGGEAKTLKYVKDNQQETKLYYKGQIIGPTYGERSMVICSGFAWPLQAANNKKKL
jgi:hypothetical protein